jgi:hypothetical protein
MVVMIRWRFHGKNPSTESKKSEKNHSSDRKLYLCGINKLMIAEWKRHWKRRH